MRLLIIVPRQERTTGNWITASRLQQGLSARGHVVDVIETDGAAEPLRAAVTAAAPQLVLLLHAWRSGRPWLETQLPIPFAVLLTGTDVNLGLYDPQQAPLITTVLQRAAAILSQNALTVAELKRAHPELAARIHHLPPGIVLGSAPFPLRERLGAAPAEPVLLCPAGIRPVKGVLELINACTPLHREGLPNALVEAVALGRPVVARAIPGNQAVVSDGVNGLLFADAAGFRTAVRRLLLDPQLRAALSVPAPQRFSVEREAGTLAALCTALLAEAGAA